MLQPKGFNWLGLALLMIVSWSGLASSAEAKKQKFTVKYSDGTAEQYTYDDSSCRLIGWQKKVGLNFSLKMMKTYQGSFGLTSDTIKELDDLEKDFGLQYEALCKDYQIRVYKGREKLYDCRRGNVSNALSGLRAIKIALTPVKDANTAQNLKVDATEMVKGILKLVKDGFKGDCVGQHLALGTNTLELAPGEMERTVPIKNVGFYDINWWTENGSSRLILDPSTGGRLSAGNATKLSVYRSPMNGGGLQK